MIYIAHRGNLEGRKAEYENDPGYIDEAIKEGYMVEVDFWKVDDRIYLGHDAGQHDITLDWLLERRQWLLAHAKNRSGMDYGLKNNLHTFWHNNDDYVQTTWNYTVGFPGRLPVGNLFIYGVPERFYTVEETKKLIVENGGFGVMSDYVKLLNT